MDHNANDSFMLFTLVFAFFMASSCFVYSLYKYMTLKIPKTLLRNSRVFFLAWMTAAYGSLMFEVVPIYTEASAIVVRLGAMGLLALVFVDTYRTH